MNQQMQFSPDIVYQLVSSNPNLKQLVEQTAYLNNMNQQVQQTRPVNNYNNMQWLQQQSSTQQPVQYTPQQSQNQNCVEQNNVTPQQTQSQTAQNISPEITETLNQFRAAVNRFDNNSKVINDNVKELFSGLENLNNKVDELLSNNLSLTPLESLDASTMGTTTLGKTVSESKRRGAEPK